MRRCVSLLTAILWLCLPLFARGQDVLPETAPETPQVSRALLVGCDRFVSQMDTAPSSANNVRRMSEALSGGSLELAALEARPEGAKGGAHSVRTLGWPPTTRLLSSRGPAAGRPVPTPPGQGRQPRSGE